MKDNAKLISKLCINVGYNSSKALQEGLKTFAAEYAEFWNSCPWYKKLYLWLRGFRAPK